MNRKQHTLMRVVLALVVLTLVGSQAWAETDTESKRRRLKEALSTAPSLYEMAGITLPDHKEREQKAEEVQQRATCVKYKRGLSGTFSKVGRFQAIQLTNRTALIIDTKEGHLWFWVLRGRLMYQGQVCPGEYMGEVIDLER